MEHQRRPDGSPPPWEDADGWVVAEADGQPGHAVPAPAPAPPDPWYANTYGEDPYGGGEAPSYEPPQPAPQPYWPGYPAAPPEAGFRWYREVAPGQWVPSDPPVSAYPANTYPPPVAAPPPPPPAPPPPAPPPAPAYPYPVAAPGSAPGPWQPPPRRRRPEPSLPDLTDAPDEPPEPEAGTSTSRLLFWTLCYFLVPVLAYFGWALTRSDVANPNCVDETGARCLSPRAEAIEAIVNVGPALAASLFLAAVAAIVMRRLTASWRTSMVGFAAAVIGAATATVVSGLLR